MEYGAIGAGFLCRRSQVDVHGGMGDEGPDPRPGRVCGLPPGAPASRQPARPVGGDPVRGQDEARWSCGRRGGVRHLSSHEDRHARRDPPGFIPLLPCWRLAVPPWHPAARSCWAAGRLSPARPGPSKANPVINWPQPSSIANPTPLTGTQLDATANVGGRLCILRRRARCCRWAVKLTAKFTPADTAAYNTAEASVTIVVNAIARQTCGQQPCRL